MSHLELHVETLREPARVLRLRGREELSSPFQFDLRLVVEDLEPEEIEAALLHRSAKLVMQSGALTRAVWGAIARTRVELSDARGRAVSGARTSRWHVRARLVPRVWFAGLGRSYRIFQNKTAREIVSSVLGGVRFVGCGSLTARPYTVQYDESDLGFVERILADEGLSYAFEHGEDGEVMVVGDRPSPLGDLEPSPVVPLRPDAGLAAGGEHFQSVQFAKRVLRRGSAVSAFDYCRPTDVTRAAEAVSPAELSGSSGDVHRHVAARAAPPVDGQIARLRLEQDRLRARIFRATSPHVGFAPGLSFQLTECPEALRDGRYHAIGVTHRADWTDGEDRYVNEVEAVPDGVHARPKAPARRVVQALETAIVTGPAAHEIHTDELGRVNVQFHWDGAGASPSSCWIRVMQPWAGEGWGFQFIPRVGMEVVVGFLGGDVDAPVVLGAVGNVLHPPVYPLPASKTRSGIRSRSTRHGDGYNELSFEDRKGYEHVFLRAQRNFNLDVLADEAHKVGGTRVDQTTGGHFRVVGGNAIDSITGDCVANVGGDCRVTITANRFGVVAGNDEARVQGNVESEVAGSQRSHVMGRRDDTVGGPWTASSEGDLTLRALGSTTVLAGGEGASRSLVLHATGSVSIAATEEATLEAPTSIVIRAGASSIVLSDDGIELHGPKIKLGAEGAWFELGGDELKVHAESKVRLEAKEKVYLKAKQGMLSLATDAKVDGSAIKLGGSDSESLEANREEAEPTTIELVDDRGAPAAWRSYVVVVAVGSERAGILDGDGRATVMLTEDAHVLFPGAGPVDAS